MNSKTLFISAILFISIFVIEVLLYQMYLLKKNKLRAYLKELENKNPELFVQTKLKILNKTHIYYALCDLNGTEIRVEINDEKGQIKTLNNVYFHHGKYYVKPVKPQDPKNKVKLISVEDYHKLKLNDRGYVFEKDIRGKIEDDKYIVLYRNPFTNEYFSADEIQGKEILTEVELMEMIPKKMDTYFFNYKEMTNMIKGEFGIAFGLFFLLPALGALGNIAFQLIFR